MCVCEVEETIFKGKDWGEKKIKQTDTQVVGNKSFFLNAIYLIGSVDTHMSCKNEKEDGCGGFGCLFIEP